MEEFRQAERFFRGHRLGEDLSQSVQSILQLMAAPSVALTQAEIQILDQLGLDRPGAKPAIRTLPNYIIKIARIGGCLDPVNDPPPGIIIMWRGLSHLTEVAVLNS